ISNVVTVTSNENDTNRSNNNASSDNVTALPVVDLIIIKTVNVTKANVTDLIEFTIAVTNNGPSNATGVNVTERLSPLVELIGNETDFGSYDGSVWNIGNLNFNETATLTLVVRILANGTISNVVTVTSNENDTNRSNNNASSDNVTALPVVDLFINKTVNATLVNVSDLIEFTIAVTNNGPSNATGVNVTERLSPLVELIGNETDFGSYDGSVWNIGNLNFNETATLTLVVRILANGTISNVVTVTSNENDTNRSNNNASSDNVTSLPIIDLSINKTVSTTAAFVGDEIVYVISVHNNGPSNATEVKVTEKLSDSVSLIDNVTAKGYYSENEGIWHVGELANGSTATLTLTVKVIKEGLIENVVVVKSKENDTNKSNNEYPCDNVSVEKINTPIDLETQNITYGEDEIITVTLPVNATGFVNITINNKTYPDVPINNGIAELTVPDLAGGDYDVIVVYGGDGKYAANSTTGKFHVARLTPIITIEVVDIWVGEVEVLNVTVNAPGSVNVTVYGITVEIPLDDGVMSTDVLQAAKAAYNGRATWNLINLPAGTYPAFAIYNGNENYSSVNTSDVFHVRARMSNVVVTAQDIYVGQDAIIKVNVGPTGVTGNVTIKVDGKSYNVNITDGKATINVPGLKAGEKSVEVIYNGDKIYSSSKNSTTFAVHKIKPQLVVDSVDIYIGENEPIVVTLPSDATGTVTITVDGVKYTAPVENGKATFDIPNLKAGKYAVDAVYSGDEKYLPTDGRDTFKVSKLKPDITINAPDITVGDNGVIKVTVPKDATGTITIEIEGKRYTQTIRNGEAGFIVPGLKVGVHDIKVYYSGDDKYLAGNTAGSIKVNPIKEDKNDTRHSPHVPVGLEKYETGNPIFILLLILLTFGSARLRRFRK
ncbi:Ig-like domain repeat protein, partial [Methanobrevibacter sp.]|uniref:Ig-like domain repeat protein n=1 Tax=Methanobrevibacter sp. TaxID=66852 RepID=UPI0026DFB7C8